MKRRKTKVELRWLIDEMGAFVSLPCREWNQKANRIANAVYKQVWEMEMEKGYFIGISL